jgi:hypothetical protein
VSRAVTATSCGLPISSQSEKVGPAFRSARATTGRLESMSWSPIVAVPVAGVPRIAGALGLLSTTVNCSDGS